MPKGSVVAIGRGSGGGSNRKSVEEHKRDGTYNATRHKGMRGRRRKGPVKLPGPPSYLTDTAKQHWVTFARKLDTSYICTEEDIEAFTMMVQSYDICQEAYLAIRGRDAKLEGGDSPVTYLEPVVAKDKKSGEVCIVGYKQKMRPELNVIAVHQKICMYHFSRFGMTPADRERVHEATESGAPGSQSAAVDPMKEFEEPDGAA